MKHTIPLMTLLSWLAAPSCAQTVYVAEETNEGPSAVDTTETETESEPVSDTAPIDGTDTQDSDSGQLCDIPTEFSWTSSEPLLPSMELGISFKDPTVIRFEDDWLVYATSFTEGNMTFLRFGDWQDAFGTEPTPAHTNPNLTGYKVAPQVFYFSPQDRWYLIYQTPDPAYSTTDDPSVLSSWNAMTTIMQRPVVNADGDRGGLDFWVICDDTDCYMFFTTAIDGALYRAGTAKASFPDGFEQAEIVMQEDTAEIFLGCSVYKLANSDNYLLLVSARNEGWTYFYRSWTSDRLNGEWTPLAATEADAFASLQNAAQTEWAESGICHGEIPRTNSDETMTIDMCNIQYLYSGRVATVEDPETAETREMFSLGLLTLSE